MMQWSPFSAQLRCLAVIVAGLACCDAAAAKQIACTKSGVAFDQAAYSAEYELLCTRETVEEDSFDQGDALLAEIEAFLRSVREGAPPVVSGEDGLRALETAMQITRLVQQSAQKPAQKSI